MNTKRNLYLLLGIGFLTTVLTIAGCSGSGSSGVERPDADQDGINNGNDPDADGDGILNNEDSSNPPPPVANPNIPCTTTKIYWPNDEVLAGETSSIRWELVPKNCSLRSDQNKQVSMKGTAGSVTTFSTSKYVGQLSSSIKVPCVAGSKVSVKYDFTALASAIGDPSQGYTNTITHTVPSKGCGDSGGGESGGGNTGDEKQCPTTNGAGGTYPSCKCQSGYDYNASTNSCDEKPEPGICTSAVVNWPATLKPSKKQQTISWTLKPAGCTVYVPSNHTGIVRGSADMVGVTGYFKFSNHQYASKGEAIWYIPCYSDGIVPPGEQRRYDLEYLEIAELLGDTNKAPYKKTYYQDPNCQL